MECARDVMRYIIEHMHSATCTMEDTMRHDFFMGHRVDQCTTGHTMGHTIRWGRRVVRCYERDRGILRTHAALLGQYTM